MGDEPIKWLGRAAADLDAIHDYISKDNSESARQIVRNILEQVKKLQVHPNLGRAGRVLGTRELIVLRGGYLVAYTVSDDRIEIIRVLHHSRHWDLSS